MVAVVNSWNEIVPGRLHLTALSRAVHEGVRSAGGVPLEFNTIAVCDGLAHVIDGQGGVQLLTRLTVALGSGTLLIEPWDQRRVRSVGCRIGKVSTPRKNRSAEL